LETIMKPTASIALAVFLLAGPTLHAQPAAFADAKLLWSLPWDADWVTAVSFVGNNKIAAGNKLGDILVWNLPDVPGDKAPLPARRLAGHTNEISRMLTTPDQKTVISASLDHTIKYWDLTTDGGEPDVVILNERARYEAESRKKKLPNPVEAKVTVQKSVRELTGHKDWVVGLSMTPDGKTLISGADRVVGPKKEKEGEIIVWDLAAGKEVRRIHLNGWPWGMAISPDGQTVIASERVPLVFDSGSRSGLKLWNAQTGAMKADLGKEIKERMAAAAFSADGKWLAICRGGEAGGLSGKVTLLDPATGKKLRETSPGHLDGATDLAFHPDGKHIFSAGRDTTVKIWRLEDGKHVRDLGQGRGGQFKDWICAIAISPDGKRLAAADMAGAVQVWALSK
jgi:WD40 repeat protein